MAKAVRQVLSYAVIDSSEGDRKRTRFVYAVARTAFIPSLILAVSLSAYYALGTHVLPDFLKAILGFVIVLCPLVILVAAVLLLAFRHRMYAAAGAWAMTIAAAVIHAIVWLSIAVEHNL
ncbi:MAG TPA: hypothetical protein VGB55_05025 [Tepidisphaeraceae bacterium]|jgi:uncharacterized membrane protein YhaH (DUF805 family)